MKQNLKRSFIPLLIVIMFTIQSNAQWSSNSTTISPTDTTKNVGIGMTSSNHKLGVTGGLYLKGNGSTHYRIRLEAGTSTEHNQIVSMDQNGNLQWKLNMLDRSNGNRFGIYSTAAQEDVLSIRTDGNVGIGMGSNGHKLAMKGSLYLKGNGSTNYRIRLVAGTSSEHNQIVSFDENENLKWKLNMLDRSNGNRFAIYSAIAGSNVLNISTSGNVGIKTNYSSTYALNVCGSIRATEVRVQTNWCDYVFNKDYELKPLEEVEHFISENKHLPDVTPGSKIESEGLDVGETSSQMIRKIEELTLYVIQLNNKMKEKDSQIAGLQKEIESLKITIK